VIASERRGAVTVITIDHAPLNLLSIRDGVVRDLRGAIADATADAGCRAMVLRGAGRCFCAGADIKDFDGSSASAGDLRQLFDAVSTAGKPVISILYGLALGAGLELALATDHRLTVAGTRLGFPEIKLGLLPGGGGTQRLPRLVGTAAALELTLSGLPIDDDKALAIGLIDGIHADYQSALAWAESKAGSTVPRRSATTPVPDPGAIAGHRGGLRLRPRRNGAAARILDCVEAAETLDLRAGLELEAKCFDELMQSDASRGLRHAFFAERRAARRAGAPEAQPIPTIRSAAVIGAGTMGTGIALAMMSAGLAVTLIDQRDDALGTALASIGKSFERDVDLGRLSVAAAAERRALLTIEHALAAAHDADLVIEAVFEDIAVKRDVFMVLDTVSKPTAILASNTSTLDIDVIAAFTRRPERVLGLHFFSPANVMRLLEVVRGARTAPEVVAAATQLSRRIGKVAVVAGVCDGFIGNRLFEEYLRQAYFLLEEGALPRQIDRALEAWGFAMGPLRAMDLAGQDIGWNIRRRRKATQPLRPYSKLPDRLCEQGRFGQKTRAGYYLYPDGRTPVVDPQIDRMVVEYSREIGLERREFSDENIVERCLFALVNEGATVVGEGVAARPSDVDVVYLNGYGLAAERGGPMFAADDVGLPYVLTRIQSFAAGRNGWAWAPAPLLVDLVGRGLNFASLNGGATSRKQWIAQAT
jgi:3-hydroxyacyl-CoA dehydrogenase